MNHQNSISFLSVFGIIFISLLRSSTLMLQPIHVSEGFRMFKRARRIRKQGLPRYTGTDKEICRKIIDACYNKEKKYFQVSAGHFCEFYMRDFGWICTSLLKLGYKKQVKSTLMYALKHYEAHGRVRTSISPRGKVFDFPMYAVDSLPYLLYCLSLLDDKKLISQYKKFLEKEIAFFISFVIDEKGLARKTRYFSSMKDHAKRKSSCYDACMLYLMQQSLERLGFFNPLRGYDYKSLILKHYWKGSYFLDDLSGRDYIAGDAQVFPFWTGVITDKNILKRVIRTVQVNKLDQPMPLRYSNTKPLLSYFDFFASGYEHSSIWLHMGPLWIDVVGRVDKQLQKKYLLQYKKHIDGHGNFLEVLNSDATPFKTFFYHTDDSMGWCVNYLSLVSH